MVRGFNYQCPCTRVGKYFDFRSNFIHASVDYVQELPLCTMLCKDGYKVRTVEHLLSALKAMGVDNCIIEVEIPDGEESSVEVGGLRFLAIIWKWFSKFVNLSFLCWCIMINWKSKMDTFWNIVQLWILLTRAFALFPSFTRNQMED